MKSVENHVFQTVEKITMTVIPTTQENLICFYKKLGYKFSGEEKEFPKDSIMLISPEYRDKMYFQIMYKTCRN
jgi:hypothetical protein